MDATSGRHAVLTTEGRGRRRPLALAVTAATLAVGLMAGAAPAGAATCTGAGAVQNRSYDVVHLVGAPEVNLTDLTGHVQQGDIISASFDTDCPNPVQVTFISYNAPGPTFSRSTAHQQTAFNNSSGPFSAGSHPNALSVTVPRCYFQVDLVQGDPIAKFGYGPGGQGFYGDQGRLVDAANGGTNACPGGTILS